MAEWRETAVLACPENTPDGEHFYIQVSACEYLYVCTCTCGYTLVALNPGFQLFVAFPYCKRRKAGRKAWVRG